MASKSGQEASNVDVEELLDAVDKTLDRLKTLYEQYFLGIQKQAPAFIHSDVERKLRDLTQINIRNTGLRYRFATLQQKFGSYNSYWRRTLRQIENGTYVRNLAKVGREAAKRGADIPDEILAAMPKRMREQVLRDRDQALALAKRRQQLDDAEAAPEDMQLLDGDVSFEDELVDAAPAPAKPAAPAKTRGGAHVLSEDDGDIDFNALFSAFDDDAPKAESARRAKPTTQRPPLPRMPLPNTRPPATQSGPTPSGGVPKPVVPTPSGPTNAIPRPIGQTPSSQTSAIPRPVAPGASGPVHQTGPVPAPAPQTATGAIPRPASQPPVGTTSAIPRPVGQQPSGPAGAVPRPVGQQPSGPAGAVPRPVGQQPSGPAGAPRATPTNIPRPETGPMPQVTQPIPRPHAPSQQSRPVPVIPGAASQTGPVPVESMSGPFPREKTGASTGSTQAIPKQPTQPIARPQTQPIAKVQITQGVPKQPLKPPPGMTEADVNALHAKYVKAKEMVGEKVDAGSREKLLKTINQTAPKIMEQYKAQGVDFSVVVKDNQVVIKAKPKL